MAKKFEVGDFVRYTAAPGTEPEYGYVKQIRLDANGLKVWVTYVLGEGREIDWKNKTAALTPIDKLEKVD
jgi:hypothetical protein